MVSVRLASLVRRVIDEIWNAGDLDLSDDLFGATYVNHGGLIPDLVRGPEGVKFSVAFYRRAFPDLHLSADDLRGNEETVILRWTGRATTDPPDRVGTLSGSTRIAAAGGQIVESWTTWNSTKVLEQLGLSQART